MFGGLQAAPRRPPPATGRFATFINLYNDSFRWSIVKSSVAFLGGVYLARSISAEVAAM